MPMKDLNYGKDVFRMKKLLRNSKNLDWWGNLTSDQRIEHSRKCIVKHNAQTGKPHSNPLAIRQLVLDWQESHPEWIETVTGENNFNRRGGSSYEASLK